MPYDVEKTDEQWREELSPEEYAVLRQAGTERAFTGEYTDTETTGDLPLQGLPGEALRVRHEVPLRVRLAELLPADQDTIEYIEDTSAGMKRVEVRCSSCGSHLGHVFPDGYGTPTGDRYCINSISLTLEPKS